MPAMAPGVHDQEHKNEETDGQQHHDPRFMFPQLHQALEELIQIHATPNVHQAGAKPKSDLK